MKFPKFERLPYACLIQDMETSNLMHKNIPPNELSMFGNACKEEIDDQDAVP